jgi:DNA-binding transcriptional LysR family regulator
MDLRRLRSFVAVAEQGSVSKAAQSLHISQPGLSRQIQELQQELGLPLFERVGRRLVPTAEGEQLIESCRDLLGRAMSLTEKAQLLKRGESGTLRISASAIQIETVLSGFLPQYSRRYPHVEVKLVEAPGPTTLAMLERGDIHLGIALIDAAQAEALGFGCHPVKPLELMAACHPACPLGRGRAVDIARIVSQPLLVLDTSFAGRKKFDAVCRMAGLVPTIRLESRAHHTQLALAEAGLGVAVISTTVQTHRYQLRTVRITYDNEPVTEPLGIVWDKRRMLAPYGRDFCEALSAYMHQVFPEKVGASRARKVISRAHR